MLRPWISTNLAISLDGKITSTRKIPSGWTSRADHQRLLILRQSADALVVGRGTLVADRMTMTVPGKQILRCVVSSGAGQIPDDHPIFVTPGGAVMMVITGPTRKPLPEKVLAHYGNLESWFEALVSNHCIKRLHCEGGGQLIRSFAALGAIDEFHLTLAGHTLFGGREAATATGVASGLLPASLEFELTHFEPCPEAGECFLSYRRTGQ
jgi:riboflavin biosynthesis pyrimidine reductase